MTCMLGNEQSTTSRIMRGIRNKSLDIRGAKEQSSERHHEIACISFEQKKVALAIQWGGHSFLLFLSCGSSVVATTEARASE